MSRRLLLVPLLPALVVGAVAAGAQDDPLVEGPPVVASGVATLVVGGERAPLSFSQTAVGPLLALPALVARLGGSLEVGPLGQGHALTLDGSTMVLGPGSPAVTAGREIVFLSQPPRMGMGGIHVPLDLVELAYGELRGLQFRWDPHELELRVERQPTRELPVTVDVVHLQGVSTVVFQFAETPRYRIEEAGSEVRVRMVGDRIAPQSRVPALEDPLVRGVAVEPEALVIHLAQGAEADEPYVLQRPFRLVFDVFRRRAVVPPRAAQTAPRSRGVKTIVLDPGHGGAELGAVGPRGTSEKEIALLLAQSLKTRLESRLPARVVLTRTEDTNLPLETRTALANQHQADLFISIHLNSSVGPQAHGAETYILSMEASDERAAAAAAEENLGVGGTDGAGNPVDDLQLILWDLAQTRYLAESQRLAKLVQEELNEALGLRDRGVKQAPFRVLMGAAMPAILVELGFLSNPAEEARLLDPEYRAQLANSLVRAVIRFRAQSDPRPEGERAPTP